MSIACLVPQFPKPSETFVSREVLTLRRLGLEVQPFAFAPPSPAQMARLDVATRRLAAEVRYVAGARLLRNALQSWPDLVRIGPLNAALPRGAAGPTGPLRRAWRAVALAGELRRGRVRHLHAHWPYATQVAWLAHRLTGLPFSASIHAHEVEHDPGHFATVFDSLSFATFCNRAAMERLRARLPAAARERCHLVYHGVDLERFRPLLFPRTNEPLRLLSSGRLTRTKGFERLVGACARARAAGLAVELTILGEGPLESGLRQLAAELGFGPHLHLPGWVPHDQLTEHYAASHLFALLADTEFHDGLPNVVLEAMAGARPVLLSPLPAANEAVTHGVEGFVLRAADDETGFVEILRAGADDPARLLDMGRAARRRVETAFDQDRHARRLLALLTPRGPGHRSARPETAAALAP